MDAICPFTGPFEGGFPVSDPTQACGPAHPHIPPQIAILHDCSAGSTTVAEPLRSLDFAALLRAMSAPVRLLRASAGVRNQCGRKNQLP